MFFNTCVENTAFCDVFLTRRLKCIVNTSVFCTFITSSSQSKPSKNTGICSNLTRQNAKKTRCLETIFRDFSALTPQVKNQWFFTLFLPPLIQTQKGVGSQKIAKLHLKSTFFLSQSLPQSSRAKKWGRLFGSQNAVNYSVLWTYHAFYLHKKAPPPPQLKLPIASASGKTRPFAPTGAGGFIYVFIYLFIYYLFIYWFIYLFIHLFIYVFIYLFIFCFLFIYLSTFASAPRNILWLFGSPRYS